MGANFRWLYPMSEGRLAHAFAYSNDSISLCKKHNRLSAIYIVANERINRCCLICKFVILQRERKGALDAE